MIGVRRNSDPGRGGITNRRFAEAAPLKAIERNRHSPEELAFLEMFRRE